MEAVLWSTIGTEQPRTDWTMQNTGELPTANPLGKEQPTCAQSLTRRTTRMGANATPKAEPHICTCTATSPNCCQPQHKPMKVTTTNDKNQNTTKSSSHYADGSNLKRTNEHQNGQQDVNTTTTIKLGCVAMTMPMLISHEGIQRLQRPTK